jgi:hypothetical protein
VKSPFFAILAALLLCGPVVSCETFGASKVAQGQLYVSGDGRYDPFFQAVHEQQIQAASWSDDRKAARKPIVTAVNVTPNASEGTILDGIRQMAKTKADAEKLAPAVEETKKADVDRIQKLRVAAEKLDALAKEGHEHEDEARKEYENRGADKADEQKSERMRQIRKELGAATEICEGLSQDAKKSARAAEDFAEDMDRALEGKDRAEHHGVDDPKRDAPRKVDADKPASDKPGDDKKGDDKKGDDKKGDDKKGEAKKPDAKKPGDKPAPKPESTKPKPKPAEKPAEKPADKPKPPDEVFSP